MMIFLEDEGEESTITAAGSTFLRSYLTEDLIQRDR